MSPPVQKGWFTRIVNGQAQSLFSFQFNPTTVQRDHTVDYDFVSAPGSPLPVASFKSVQGQTITLQLLLDAVENYDAASEGITAQLSELESFVQPDIDQFSAGLGSFISPPEVRYGMGRRSWNVVVTNLSIKEERWSRKAIPTRARVDFTMRTNFVDVADIRAQLERMASLRERAGWVA